MSDLLIRGIPRDIRNRIQLYADSQNLSVNQFVVRTLKQSIGQMETEKEKEERRKEAFRRIDEIREELYRKHGLFEDSAKLIREDRDSR